MQTEDGKGRFTCLVPEVALPHRESVCGVAMRQQGTPKPVNVISGFSTSEETVGRYSQCVVMGLRSLPTHDFRFEIKGGMSYDSIKDWTIESSPIQWNTHKEIELYVLASNFGNDRVCDMILDEWRNRVYTAGVDSLDYPPPEDVFLVNNTWEGHPVRRFWGHVILAQGHGTIIWKGETIVLTRNFRGARYGLRKLMKMDKDWVCSSYHLHTGFGVPCYRASGGSCFFDPDWTEFRFMHKSIRELEEQLEEEFEAAIEGKTATEEGWEAYVKLVDDGKRNLIDAFEQKRAGIPVRRGW